jgi:hypothetical protein
VQEAIKRFGADGGSIINFSSIVGSHPMAGAPLYASTKGAKRSLGAGKLDEAFQPPDDLRFLFGTRFDVSAALAKLGLVQTSGSFTESSYKLT